MYFDSFFIYKKDSSDTLVYYLPIIFDIHFDISM